MIHIWGAFNHHHLTMKKLLALTFVIGFSLSLWAQADSGADSAIVKVDSIKKKDPKFKLEYSVTLASRNIWRGLDYGSSPNLSGDFRLAHKYFGVGVVGTMTLNGSR